ncbi:ABC transporter substrate-binding protein [Paracoccus sp. MBLB3053]|uniref:ABC transporter substrate-binding protein n=1 Tax=Paracoccus aurantius TaxID=3073814 RepID=A0ABU2HUV9_9RHOB|nr:ABC transporter substrate-binding protein [Paracoccus sp. MBLB3053]MDS9468836.1 ABC transporter substrate-binding protein [Paracoccus sp. MBLB3053]
MNRKCAPHWITTIQRVVLCALLVLGTALAARAELSAIDVTGQKITLPAPARRIVLGEGRHLTVLGMLHDDPVALVAGWRTDKGIDPATGAAYAARFPRIAQIATVGAGNRQISVEQVLALQPDLLLLSLMDHADPQTQQQIRQIRTAGIPVAFIDFFSHPIENTPPSLKLLGTLTGAEAKAAELAQFYASHLNAVRERLAKAAPAAPRVFVEAHATPEKCCLTVGAGVYDEFISAAGGQNIGRDLVPGVMGNVGLENLLVADPDVLVATGGEHMAARGGLVLGAGIAPELAQDSFKNLLAAPGIAQLRAVREGRAHAIWHLFNDTPLHVVLVEYLAKSLHPELFADLDPEATMAEMERRFSPVGIPGTWWLDQP